MSDVSISVEADDNPLYDQTVMDLFAVAAEHEAFGALEIALMELALWDLHANQDAMYEILKSESDAMISKSHRAALSAYHRLRADGRDVSPSLIRKYLSLVRKDEVSGGRTITIAEYKRRDGTLVPEHERTLPEGFTARSAAILADITSEVMEAANSDHKKGDPEWDAKIRDAIKAVVIDAPREMREGKQGKSSADEVLRELKSSEKSKRFHNIHQTLFVDSEVQEAGKRVIKATSWGDRLSNVMDLVLAKTEGSGSTIKFAAKAIREYGPIAGVRMANAYRRYGGYDVPMSVVGDSVVTEKGDVLPEVKSATESRQWAIETLKSRLPGDRAYKSRSEPPSEGFIIDGRGNIIAHGVGRGSDHFLPFNIQHLKMMLNKDRVEYVRSRMVGGITQEDLHAAMMLGADKITVVSNSGEFTLDLTQRSHGIKLEHMQVLMRYQEILDDFRAAKGKGQNYGKLTGDGYMQALEAISDEFPLHLNFSPDKNKPGIWFEKVDDYVRPRSRFIDDLRRLFGVKGQTDQYGNPIDPSSQKARSTQPGRGTSMADELFGGQRWPTAFRDFEIQLAQGGVARGTPEYYARAIEKLNSYLEAFSPNSRARTAINEKIDVLMKESEARVGGVQQTPGVRQTWQQDAVRSEIQEELDTSPRGTVVTRQIDPDPDAGGTSDLQKDWLNNMSARYSDALKAVGIKYRTETVDPDQLEGATVALDLVNRSLRDRAPGMSARDHVLQVLEYYDDDLADLFRLK